MKKLHTYLLPFFIMAFSFSTTFVQAQQLVATCNSTSSELYFGETDFQTAIITGTATGGTGPYTITITMNRPIICNYIDASGNETFVGIAGQTTNGDCVTGSPNQPPTATMTNAVAGVPFAVNATLLENATFTTTVTDAVGSTATSTVTILAVDVRCISPGNSGPHKGILCHRTSSLTNPFVTICVDSSAFPKHIANHTDVPYDPDIGCPDDIRRITTVTTGTRKGTDADENALKEKSVKRLDVKATPNPSAGYFTLRTQSVSSVHLQLKVLDVLGRVVETKNNIEANSTITLGSKYSPGAYLVEVIQGDEKRKLRLLKQ
jgi:hypothetical protein